MDPSRPRLAAWTAALVLCIAAVGCDTAATGPGDSNPPGQPPEDGFEAAAEAMDHVTRPPAGSLPARRQLGLAGQALAEAGAGVVLQGLALAPALPSGPSGLAATFQGSTAAVLSSLAGNGDGRMPRAYGRVVGLATAETVFPPVLLGKTFAWDFDDGRYVVDPGRRGAPADGLRFLLYEADPDTGEPASDAVIGRLDLTDRSQGTATRLGVRALRTAGGPDVVLLDYVVEGTGGLEGSDFVVRLEAEGFVSDAVDRMDFDFAEEVAFGSDFQSLRVSIDDAISVPSRDLSARVSIEGETTGQSSQAGLELVLESGPDEIVLSVESNDQSQTGSLTYNGERVVIVQGSTEQPIFTDAAGSALDAGEVESLRRLWDSIEALLGVAEEILSPLADILSFQVL